MTAASSSYRRYPRASSTAWRSAGRTRSTETSPSRCARRRLLRDALLGARRRERWRRPHAARRLPGADQRRPRRGKCRALWPRRRRVDAAGLCVPTDQPGNWTLAVIGRRHGHARLRRVPPHAAPATARRRRGRLRICLRPDALRSPTRRRRRNLVSVRRRVRARVPTRTAVAPRRRISRHFGFNAPPQPDSAVLAGRSRGCESPRDGHAVGRALRRVSGSCSVLRRGAQDRSAPSRRRRRALRVGAGDRARGRLGRERVKNELRRELRLRLRRRRTGRSTWRTSRWRSGGVVARAQRGRRRSGRRRARSGASPKSYSERTS